MTKRRLFHHAVALLTLVVVATAVTTFGHASTPASARTLTSPLRHPRGAPIRILVYHDLEGLAGQDDWRSFLFGHPEKYPEGQQLLAADVNAVVDGLFAGGATQVDVAMHAKTGSRGFASHTFTLGMDMLPNGTSITESEVVGYSWGRVGVPMIFVSGDDRLRDDLKVMPWIEFVVTKKATSASTVELRPVDAVHAEMREKAARGAQGHPGHHLGRPDRHLHRARFSRGVRRSPRAPDCGACVLSAGARGDGAEAPRLPAPA